MCVRNICCSTSLTAIKGFKDFQPGCHIHTMAIIHIFSFRQPPTFWVPERVLLSQRYMLPKEKYTHHCQLCAMDTAINFDSSPDLHDSAFRQIMQIFNITLIYSETNFGQLRKPMASNEKYTLSCDLALFIRKPIYVFRSSISSSWNMDTFSQLYSCLFRLNFCFDVVFTM